MTEVTASTEDAAAARALEQARLRKERREAKIRAGGDARLNKITGLGGRAPQEPETPTPRPAPTSPSVMSGADTPQSTATDDPEEVDISKHYYEPRTTQRPSPSESPSVSENQLRQMMMGLERPPSTGPSSGRASPFPGDAAMGGNGFPPELQDDPMVKMMQQMMGGGLPFPGLGGQPSGAESAAQAVANRSGNIWGIIHAVFALGLGLYVAHTTTFSGTKAEREFSALSSLSSTSATTSSSHSETDTSNYADSIDQTREYFFYLFMSVETVLLTSRLFMDRNRPPAGGIMNTIAGFLPGGLGKAARHALRFAPILGTVRSDALVCVFVLGVCAWLRS